jgi:hypothetical protein
MTTQPEALRLAEFCDFNVLYQPAAAELRRLHEAHEWQYTMAGERLRRIEKLETTNNEMLSALKRIKETGVFLGAIAQEMMDSAIKKAEGTE